MELSCAASNVKRDGVVFPASKIQISPPSASWRCTAARLPSGERSTPAHPPGADACSLVPVRLTQRSGRSPMAVDRRWPRRVSRRLSLRIVPIDQHAGVGRRERGRAGLRVGDAVGQTNRLTAHSRLARIKRLGVQRPFAVVQQVAGLRVHGVRLRRRRDASSPPNRAHRRRWRRPMLRRPARYEIVTAVGQEIRLPRTLLLRDPPATSIADGRPPAAGTRCSPLLRRRRSRRLRSRCRRADRVSRRCSAAARPRPPLSSAVPPAKNAIHRLSGDQNNRPAPSVPASFCPTSHVERPDEEAVEPPSRRRVRDHAAVGGDRRRPRRRACRGRR